MGDGLDPVPALPNESVSGARASGKVLVTGASGFVGRYVTRELLTRGYAPVCLTRRPAPSPLGVTVVRGDLSDAGALDLATEGCTAVIHLVGIIAEKRCAGSTFERVHVEGTRNVVAACLRNGVRRYVHMSALGARPSAPTAYFQTKWAAEEVVRGAELDWTIFRPSIIHGPDGEFMQMMKFFATSRLRVPFMPYFGSGNARVQPIDVRDVAACFVRCLSLPETIGKAYELGGPQRLSWKQLYDVCAEAITGRRRLKLPVPTFAAKLAARTVLPLVPSFLMPYKFDAGQVRMSQEDSICDHRPIEATFGIRLRDFREALSQYADQI